MAEIYPHIEVALTQAEKENENALCTLTALQEQLSLNQHKISLLVAELQNTQKQAENYSRAIPQVERVRLRTDQKLRQLREHAERVSKELAAERKVQAYLEELHHDDEDGERRLKDYVSEVMRRDAEGYDGGSDSESDWSVLDQSTDSLKRSHDPRADHGTSTPMQRSTRSIGVYEVASRSRSSSPQNSSLPPSSPLHLSAGDISKIGDDSWTSGGRASMDRFHVGDGHPNATEPTEDERCRDLAQAEDDPVMHGEHGGPELLEDPTSQHAEQRPFPDSVLPVPSVGPNTPKQEASTLSDQGDAYHGLGHSALSDEDTPYMDSNQIAEKAPENDGAEACTAELATEASHHTHEYEAAGPTPLPERPAELVDADPSSCSPTSEDVIDSTDDMSSVAVSLPPHSTSNEVGDRHRSTQVPPTAPLSPRKHYDPPTSTRSTLVQVPGPSSREASGSPARSPESSHSDQASSKYMWSPIPSNGLETIRASYPRGRAAVPGIAKDTSLSPSSSRTGGQYFQDPQSWERYREMTAAALATSPSREARSNTTYGMPTAIGQSQYAAPPSRRPFARAGVQ